MDFDGLLTTIVLSALVLIFGSILRRSANLRLHFWFIAWTLILIHCVVQWLGIPGFSDNANDIVVVDTLVCAGTAFMCALCSITQKYYLLLVAAVFVVPLPPTVGWSIPELPRAGCSRPQSWLPAPV